MTLQCLLIIVMATFSDLSCAQNLKQLPVRLHHPCDSLTAPLVQELNLGSCLPLLNTLFCSNDAGSMPAFMSMIFP